MPKLNPEQIAGAVLQAGWSQKDAPRAVAVVLAESGGDTRAANPRSSAYGLFQILEGTARDAKVSAERVSPDPVAQARAGLAVLRMQGWCAWAVIDCAGRKIDMGTGAYLKHMPVAADAVAAAQGKPPGFYVSPGIPGVDAGPVAVPLPDWVVALKSLTEFLIDPQRWLRVAQVVGGGVLVLTGLLLLASDLLPARSALKATKTLRKVRGVSKTAGAARKAVETAKGIT